MTRTAPPGRGEIDTARPRIWPNVLSPHQCRAVVEAMARSATVTGPVLRRSDDVVDVRVRDCTEHLLTPDQAAPVVAAMRAVAARALADLGHNGCALDGPKFCAYGERGMFRAHRDSSDDPLDPVVVRRRRLTVVCLLNDTTYRDGLPAYDGGALIVHVPRAGGILTPETVRAEAGAVVTFGAGLLHEVRPVRSGTRCSAVGWLHDAYGDATANDPTANDPTAHDPTTGSTGGEDRDSTGTHTHTRTHTGNGNGNGNGKETR